MSRLLIVNCSAKKSGLPRGRAIDIYASPWFSIIRKALDAGVEPTEVYVLSGKYGLIHGEMVIDTYDHKANPETDQWLLDDAEMTLRDLSSMGYSDIYIGVMSTYSWILPDEATLREWFPNCTIRPVMPLGHGFHHLQEWLYGRPMTKDVTSLNRLLVMGAATAPSQGTPKAAWDTYNTPSYKALREVRDAGVKMPRILILTTIGPISHLTPAIPAVHRPIRDGDAAAKAMTLSTIQRMIGAQGELDEVYLDKFPGVDYVFADPQSILGEAKVVKSSGNAKDLAMWLRGEAPIPSTSGGKRSTIPVYAQPLDKSVRPYVLIESWVASIALEQMEASYRQGYRLLSFSSVHVPDSDGCDGADKVVALMAMPQACLF